MDWVVCWSAAQRGNWQKVRQWLPAYVFPNALFRIAMIAAINDHADVLKLILVHIECAATALLSMGDLVQRMFCKAAFHGSLCALRVLLADYKAEVNMPLPWSGMETHRYPICAALQGHQLAVVGALLQAKCHVDTTYTTNALCDAVSLSCHPRLITKICKAGVWGSTRTREEYCCSVLQLACQKGGAPAVSVLLTHTKVDVNGGCGRCTSLRGHTPLRCAAEHGHIEVVLLLLRHKADVYKMSTSGNTALSKARANHHDDIVRLLLDAGTSADKNYSEDYSEDYAEDYADHADTDSADAFW